MGKLPQRTPTPRKESTEVLSELEAAVSALREEFVRKFRTERHASASTTHLQIQDSVPEIWEVLFAEKEGMREQQSVFAQDPRHVFSEQLNDWCRTFPVLLKEFIEGLCRMRYAIDWVQLEAEKTWPLLKEEYREWVIIACDGQAARQDWCAPRWLEKWPAEVALPAVALRERLDADSTAKVLRMVAAQVEGRLDEGQRMALNHARVLIAQGHRERKDSAPKIEPPKRSKRDRRKLTSREKKILEIIQEDTDLRGMPYCRALESRKIPTLPKWQREGCPIHYPEAYKDPKWRKRIQDEKYRLSRLLAKK